MLEATLADFAREFLGKSIVVLWHDIDLMECSLQARGYASHPCFSCSLSAGLVPQLTIAVINNGSAPVPFPWSACAPAYWHVAPDGTETPAAEEVVAESSLTCILHRAASGAAETFTLQERLNPDPLSFCNLAPGDNLTCTSDGGAFAGLTKPTPPGQVVFTTSPALLSTSAVLQVLPAQCLALHLDPSTCSSTDGEQSYGHHLPRSPSPFEQHAVLCWRQLDHAMHGAGDSSLCTVHLMWPAVFELAAVHHTLPLQALP